MGSVGTAGCKQRVGMLDFCRVPIVVRRDEDEHGGPTGWVSTVAQAWGCLPGGLEGWRGALGLASPAGSSTRSSQCSGNQGHCPYSDTQCHTWRPCSAGVTRGTSTQRQECPRRPWDDADSRDLALGAFLPSFFLSRGVRLHSRSTLPASPHSSRFLSWALSVQESQAPLTTPGVF